MSILPQDQGQVADQGAEGDQRERDVPERRVPVEVSAQLLARPRDRTRRSGPAGTSWGACSGNSKSLSTNQAISLGNPVTSSFCLPPFTTSGVNVGIATSITELAGNARHDPRSASQRSAPPAPVAAAMDFGPAMVTFEFRVWDAALPSRLQDHAGRPQRGSCSRGATRRRRQRATKAASSTSSRRRATRRSGRSSSRRRRTGRSPGEASSLGRSLRRRRDPRGGGERR